MGNAAPVTFLISEELGLHGKAQPATTSRQSGTSLVVQWLRIHLPMQRMQVQSLVREDSTCRGAAEPATATEASRL